MTEKEAEALIKSCMNPLAICKLGFDYQQYEEFFFPISVSSSLFLGIAERDFRLDGFCIKRLSDITSVEGIRGTYLSIHKSEGNLSLLTKPPISLDSWQSACRSVAASGEIISIEGFTAEGQIRYFLIGRILAIGDHGIRFRSFDGSGTWSDKAITVPYSSMISLTIGSSYITTYSKYVKPYPELKNIRN